MPPRTTTSSYHCCHAEHRHPGRMTPAQHTDNRTLAPPQTARFTSTARSADRSSSSTDDNLCSADHRRAALAPVWQRSGVRQPAAAARLESGIAKWGIGRHEVSSLEPPCGIRALPGACPAAPRGRRRARCELADILCFRRGIGTSTYAKHRGVGCGAAALAMGPSVGSLEANLGQFVRTCYSNGGRLHCKPVYDLPALLLAGGVFGDFLGGG